MYNIDYEHQKRIPLDGNVDIDKFVRYGGYYDINNNWNSIVQVEGYPDKILRGRVEVILFKDDKIFLDNSINRYRLPGGSFDINRSNEAQVFNEIKEEAKILSKNIMYSGLSYVRIFDKYSKPSKTRMSWHGTYNEVYFAEYNKPYNGFIRGCLYDRNMHNNGCFYPLLDILPILKDEHITALKMLKII